MAITINDVEHVASLARLSFNDGEKKKLATELNDILKYVEHINSLDTSAVEPLSHVIELSNVFRADGLRPSISREEALKNAPVASEKFFKVPKVINER